MRLVDIVSPTGQHIISRVAALITLARRHQSLLSADVPDQILLLAVQLLDLQIQSVHELIIVAAFLGFLQQL